MRRLLVVREAGDNEAVEPELHHHIHHHHYHKQGEGEGYVALDHPVVASVQERMENPPATWTAYADHPNGMMAVIDMEHQELAYAKASGDPTAIKKELTDLAAACICALQLM